MNSVCPLAIVIPAYKDEFLADSLASLASQTCKDFNVYVGDDASPYNVKAVVAQFSDELNLHYTRFETNLGGRDLVGQWQRCIDLVGGEEFICLFSDDDVMEPSCVESFYSCMKENADVFHFDIKIIDDENKILRICPPFPRNISASDYYLKLFRHEIDARMPEFIFRRSALNLISFDLAWRSDTATVIQASFPNGIYTIPSNGGNCVRWRSSSKNVSGVSELNDRKNNSSLAFFNWVDRFFRKNGLRNPFSVLYHLKMIVFSIEYSGFKPFVKTGLTFAHKLNCVKGFGYPLFLLLMAYRLVYRQFE